MHHHSSKEEVKARAKEDPSDKTLSKGATQIKPGAALCVLCRATQSRLAALAKPVTETKKYSTRCHLGLQGAPLEAMLVCVTS